MNTMALSSKVHRILLMKNLFLRIRLSTKRKKGISVHEINKKRSVLGEFHHVYEELRRDRERFFSFLPMPIKTFDFLLSKVDTV